MKTFEVTDYTNLVPTDGRSGPTTRPAFAKVTQVKIENLKKEGKKRISISIFIYTIHFAYLKVYTKIHNPKSSSC